MMAMRIIAGLLRFLFVISLPLLFASISVRSVTNSAWFYERGFDTYGVSRTTGLERDELVKAGKALIVYFDSAEEPLSVEVRKAGKTMPLFNEREIAHLKDVKDLFNLTNRIGEIAGLYLIVYAVVTVSQSRRSVSRELVGLVLQGSALTVGIIVLLGLGSLIDFRSLFVVFHLISFRNDLWMLDPSQDYLIMMFPAGFWLDATIAVATLTALLGLAVGGVAYVYLAKRQRNVAAGGGMAPR